MRLEQIALACVLLEAVAVIALAQTSDAGRQSGVLTGKAAFGDWRVDAPLVRRKISVDDLPKPFATRSVNKPVRMIARPSGALPRVPPGFQVELFAAGFKDPRALVVAPNGDLFVAESEPGRIRVLRAREGEGKPRDNTVFASGLDAPFGIAFYPPGPDPHWVYTANVDSVVRYPYRNGDIKAAARPQVIVRSLASAGGPAVQRGHITRDLAFSKDGRQMFVSIGSASNNGEGMGRRNAGAIARWEAANGLGSAWGNDTRRHCSDNRNSGRHRQRFVQEVLHHVPQQFAIFAKTLAVRGVRQNHVLAIAARQLAEEIEQIVIR